MFRGAISDHTKGTLSLLGDEADEYVDLLGALVEGARLNDLYPSSQGLLDSLTAMDSRTHLGLYDGVEVHLSSGLPTYKEFVRVSSDQYTAPKELTKLQQWHGRSVDGEIYQKLARKRSYLGALNEMGSVMGEQTQLFFRKIDRQTQLAKFKILLDRFNPAGVLERVTVELAQRSSLWGKRGLNLDNEDVVHISEHLKGLVYRFSIQEVEFIFARLAAHDDIEVETVTKGSIGPVVFSGLNSNEQMRPLMKLACNGAILAVGLQTASFGQLRDVSNDPLCNGCQLSLDARVELCKAKGREHPYHVLKDRKFSICEVNRKTLQDYLVSSNTKNVIYEI